MATNTDGREEIKPVAPTEQTKWRDPSLVGKYMVDPKTGLAGLFRSPDNGENWVLTDTVFGHVYSQDEVDNIWDNGAGHKVADEIKSATADLPNVRKQADEAVKFAESAIAASKVNSDAIVAQSEAISEAKSAMDSATAEIQQLKANAASDVAKIRADVAQVQNEVDTAKSANSASVDKLKSDIGLVQKDLDNVHDSLTKAQSAVEQNQKLINDSVAKINSDIAQSRQDIVTAQQANNDLAKQLDTYSKEAQAQGKTIKAIQDNQDGFSITIADVKGDVTKVSDTVDGLSAGLKDAQGNIASVKAQADQLNATLTDHSKDIAQLTATAKELSSTLEDADGRLSKVEQTASEQSTTLSDLQGNLTQVKQTADNLVTTLKDAQGNIDQIKQDAKGTLEQLSNAQGDITALQKDVSGIKLTIADHDKNIHTLQADSKTLKDDMADAKGNISSLQKTSTSLVSEFRDHDGRLSKVEQTATEHTSELADTKGNLDKVTQKADNLQLLLSDAQKNIQNIQLDAKGLHDTLTGQSNQLASLNVTLNNLDSKYSGITGDLQSKQTSLSTEQQQTKDMLLRKADKSEVDDVKGTVNHISAEQKTMAGQISQKVSSAEYQTLRDKVNNLRIGGRNLIPNSGTDIVVESKTTDAYPQWDNHLLYSSLQSNTTYTFSVSATNTNGVEQTSVRIYKERLDGKYFNKEAARWYFNADGKRHNFTFTTPNDAISYDIWLYAGPMGTLQGKNFTTTYHHPQLELGNIESDYSPNPDDAIAAISKNTTAIDENSKAIKLKADQTEVNNVKSTAQQLSSRLDIMAGEIKSKVTSTDVDNIVDKKGYATTSTVQSLITQKAGTINESITNLTNEVNTRNGVNLLKGTKDFSGSWHNYGSTNYWHTENWIDPNGNHSVKSDSLSWYGYYQPIYLDTGDYTFSGYYYSEGGKPVFCYIRPNSGDNLVEVSYNSNLDSTPNGWRWFVVHFKVTKAGNAAVRLESGQNQVLHIASYKLERGTVTKPVWTPAPSDNATVTQVQQITASIDGLQSRVTNYQNDTSSKYTQLSSLMQSKVNQGDLSSVRTQLANAINDRVGKGELMSQINLQAGNTLIQSNKLYLDADSVVFSGKAFIPDAAITNISADKINAGWLNTNNVSLGDGRTRIRADHDYLYIQPTGSASSNTGIRMSYTGLDFLTNVIPNGYNSPVPYYSIGYDGASNGYLRISAFDHLNSGGATATQNWFTMVDAISLTNSEINFATKGNMHMQVFNGGVNIKPTLFFQNNTNNGTWAGFTRGDNSDIVEFSTSDNNGENFRIDCGARFMQYVYINGNARAQQWLTNSTLSKKTNIRKLDQQIALDKIRQDDQYLYEYKRNIEQGIYDPQASFIIDDVNDVSHYSVPREFIDQSGNYREPNVELAYLIAAFQAIDKQVQKQKEEIKELKEKLQHE